MAKEGKGFVDKTRDSYAGMKGVHNVSAWGESKATERYGGDTRTFPPEDLNANKPQKLGDPSNQQGNHYDNDVRDSWLRGAGESAEGKPNFTPGYRAPRGEPGTRGGPPLRSTDKYGPHRDVGSLQGTTQAARSSSARSRAALADAAVGRETKHISARDFDERAG